MNHTLTRRILLLAILSFLIIPLTVSESTAEIAVCISPELTRVGENGIFVLDVTIEPDIAISGAELTLMYDPALVQVTSVKEGDLLTRKGEKTIFSPGTIDNVNGSVKGIYGLVLGKEIDVEKGTFVSIGFNATGKGGVAAIEIKELTITNSVGGKLPVSVKDAQVSIGNGKEHVPNDDVGETRKLGDETQLVLAFSIAASLRCIRKRKDHKKTWMKNATN